MVEQGRQMNFIYDKERIRSTEVPDFQCGQVVPFRYVLHHSFVYRCHGLSLTKTVVFKGWLIHRDLWAVGHVL